MFVRQKITFGIEELIIMYQIHRKLDINEIPKYIFSNTKFFDNDADLSVSELSDGNINYVYRIEDPQKGRTLILKQADKVLRSSGRPLDTKRSEIEAKVLMIQNEICADFVPKVYHYDPIMCVLLMEDIGAYKNMRYEMIERKTFVGFLDQITEYIAKTAINTTEMVITRKEKKERVAQFINIELCDISEDLVFTEPYTNYKNQNMITLGNEKYVKQHIYCNPSLIREAEKLKMSFMSNAQALIHGDLHSGSIFINEVGIKVIDPEFGFYGPVGYDVGNVLAHLMIPLVVCRVTDAGQSQESEFERWLLSIIGSFENCLRQKITTTFRACVKDTMVTDEFITFYIDSILSDARGFAGLEVIRRTIGDTKVLELENISDTTEKIMVERKLIDLAIELIMTRYTPEQLSHVIYQKL